MTYHVCANRVCRRMQIHTDRQVGQPIDMFEHKFFLDPTPYTDDINTFTLLNLMSAIDM